MGPMSYEGPEKYIFISYAHRDSDQVLKILEKLVDSGYRLWYDDGIAPGSEWPEDIAEHLDGCAVFLAFISNHSMESSNCRREINFALSRHKPFLGVILEPTTMSLGMEMQLSSQQCILRYHYRSEVDFLRKIFSCPDLQCCKIPEPAKPQPSPIREEQPAPKPIIQQSIHPQPPVPEKLTDPHPAPPKKKPTAIAIFAAAVLVLILSFAIVWAAYSSQYTTLAPDMTVSSDTNTVTLRDMPIDANTIGALNSLKNLSSLYIYDCTVAPGTLDQLSIPMLRELYIHNTPVPDFYFLESTPDIYSLSLENCGVNDGNFPGEALTGVTFLSLAGNPEFSQLSQIDPSALLRVDVSGTAVYDISCLAGAQGIWEIRCADTQVSDVEALAQLRNLKTLDCANCPISQVSTPFMSLFMETLDFRNCGLDHIDGFQNFTILERVFLGGNQLKDVQFLSKSSATLLELDLSGNPLSQSDLEFIREAWNLTYLNLSYLDFQDASLVSDLSQLTRLYASCCQLRDISPLRGLDKLKELYLDSNQITSLEGLPSMGDSSVIRLNLAYNRITDLSTLSGDFYSVALQGNPLQVDDPSFITCFGHYLTLDYHESLFSDVCFSFSNVYVVNCPADKQVALQEKFGNAMHCVTEEELLAKLAELKIRYPYLSE